MLRWLRRETQHYKIVNAPPESLLPSRPRLPLRYRHIPCLEIARQLCIQTFAAYSKIEARELFTQPWAKEKTQHKCPNIMQMIHLFNGIAQKVNDKEKGADDHT